MNSILIDFDGVLTNGKVSISPDGTQLFKEVHTRDIRAIRWLIANGYEVYIITASSSPIIKAYCDKVGAELIVARDKMKAITERGITDYVAIGDDAWDVEMLKNAKEAYCPEDAHLFVRDMPTPHMNILNTRGGEGCVSEFVDKLCKANREVGNLKNENY